LATNSGSIKENILSVDLYSAYKGNSPISSTPSRKYFRKDQCISNAGERTEIVVNEAAATVASALASDRELISTFSQVQGRRAVDLPGRGRGSDAGGEEAREGK